MVESPRAVEMMPNKPVDFSWRTEKVDPQARREKKEIDFSNCSNIKYLSRSGEKIGECEVETGNCKLGPSIPNMAYLFDPRSVCAKDNYEEGEVQDLSIHHRGNSLEKEESTLSVQARTKRKTSRNSSLDQEGMANGGLHKIYPKQVESPSVIPRCHLDLSVSRIVENLSKAVQDKWNDDDFELSEMEKDDKIEQSAVKSESVYFKCSEASLMLKCTDPVYPKSMPVDYSGSEESLSWHQEDQASRQGRPLHFDSWISADLKKEMDKLDSCKTGEQNCSDGQDVCIKSELKTEPEYGMGYEKMEQNPGTAKYPTQSGSQGVSPIQLNFICKICGQNFRNRQYRDFHVKLHKSSHSFLCNLCSAGFDTEAECAEHQKLHTDPIYQCDNCGYRCTREFRMRAHKEICGEPAKIYKCPFCDKQFAAQRYMRIHMKSHDTRNVHTCPHCQNTYPLKNSLLKHMKKKHGI